MSDEIARVLTLGPLEAVRTDEQVPSGLTGRRKPLCLLVYLLVGRPSGNFHERSTLCTVFWPESDERHARASLRQALRTIDRELGPVLEKRGRGGIRVRPGSVWVDLPPFRAAVDAGRWARAVALYRGPFLDGVYLSGAPTFERWVDRIQLECAAAYKSALRHLASGDVPGIQDLTRSRLWQELSALAPYDAATALSLARTLDGAGHSREARTALERYLGRLEAETSLEAPETVRRALSRLPEAPGAGGVGETAGGVEGPTGKGAASAGRSASVDPSAPPDAGGTAPVAGPRAVSEGDVPAFSGPQSEPPRRRGWPRSLVAGSLAAGAVVALLSSGSLSPPSGVGPEEPLRVAVPPLLAGEDPIRGSALSLIVGEELSRLENVEVIPYHVLGRELSPADPETPTGASPVDRYVAAAVSVGADLVVLGSVFPPPHQGPEVVLDLVEPASGETVGSSILSLPGAEDPVRDAAARAATRIADAFARPAAARGEHARAQTPPSLEAYLAFVEALAAFAAIDYPAAEAHARRALELDPAFAPARVELATQLLNRGDWEGAAAHVAEVRRSGTLLTTTDRERLAWLEAVLEADRSGRLEVVRTGGAWWTPHQLAHELTGLGRPGDAVAVLREAEREDRFPEFREREASTWATALHMLGDHAEEVRLVRRRREDMRPLRGVLLEVRALVAAGRPEVAEAVLADAPFTDAEARLELMYQMGIELLAHGSPEEGVRRLSRAADAVPAGLPPGSRAHTRRSEALFAAGRWSEARSAFEERLALRPDDIHARGALAVIDARTGSPDRARAVGDALIEGGPPGNAGTRLVWRARIAAALGDHDQVARYLELARGRGAARPAGTHTAPEWRFLPDRGVLDRWLEVS